MWIFSGPPEALGLNGVNSLSVNSDLSSKAQHGPGNITLTLSRPWQPFVPAIHNTNIAAIKQHILRSLRSSQRKFDIALQQQREQQNNNKSGQIWPTEPTWLRHKWGRPTFRCNISSVLEWVGAEISRGAEPGYFERRALTDCGHAARIVNSPVDINVSLASANWTFKAGDLLTVVAFADPFLIPCAESASGTTGHIIDCERRRGLASESARHDSAELGLPMHAIFRGVATIDREQDSIESEQVTSHYLFGSTEPDKEQYEMDMWMDNRWYPAVKQHGGGPNGLRPPS